MPKYSSASKAFCVAVFLALITTCALGIGAQSGRRARKPEPTPSPTPEATPTPTPADTGPRFKFILGLDKFGDFSQISLYVYDGVLRSCADRLDDSRVVTATVSPKDMSRGTAIRQAKAEQEAYVIWIQLRRNEFGTSSDIYADSTGIYIEYAVFEPTTAKQVTSGSTFPAAYRKGVKIPNTTTGGDYYLNQAARGAAERILDHFHVLRSIKLP